MYLMEKEGYIMEQITFLIALTIGLFLLSAGLGGCLKSDLNDSDKKAATYITVSGVIMTMASLNILFGGC